MHSRKLPRRRSISLARRLLPRVYARNSLAAPLRGFARDGMDPREDLVASDPGNATAQMQHPSAMMIAGNDVGKTVINVTLT